MDRATKVCSLDPTLVDSSTSGNSKKQTTPTGSNDCDKNRIEKSLVIKGFEISELVWERFKAEWVPNTTDADALEEQIFEKICAEKGLTATETKICVSL